MKLDAEPRSTIDVMFAALADSFYAEEPIRSLLTTTTTVTPDDVINKGKIVVLSTPTSIYHEAGRMAQFAFKYSFQRAMLRRRKPADGSPVRPTVLWVDEAHQFAHEFDAEYFAEVRSNRGINVFLEQSVGGYMNALGLNHIDQADGFLANLTVKLFFQTGSPQTQLFAAQIIGQTLQKQRGESTSYGKDTFNVGDSATEVERFQVLPSEFSTLRRGGHANRCKVEFIISCSGRRFNQTQATYARSYFTQTELTR